MVKHETNSSFSDNLCSNVKRMFALAAVVCMCLCMFVHACVLKRVWNHDDEPDFKVLLNQILTPIILSPRISSDECPYKHFMFKTSVELRQAVQEKLNSKPKKTQIECHFAPFTRILGIMPG